MSDTKQRTHATNPPYDHITGEEKMTKYYTMKECFDECEDDDYLINKDFLNKMKKSDIDPTMRFSIGAYFSNQWQIQRAEPVVLEVTGYLRKKHNITAYSSNPANKFNEYDMQRVFTDADKNGQLREWLRPEQVELREAVKGLITNENHKTLPNHLYDIKVLIENLKPPTTD